MENFGRFDRCQTTTCAFERTLLAYPNTLRWTWSSFEHPWNDSNFCKRVGMAMVAIHFRFGRFLTPYASCDMSGYLSVFLSKNPEKTKFDRKNVRCSDRFRFSTVPWSTTAVGSYSIRDVLHSIVLRVVLHLIVFFHARNVRHICFGRWPTIYMKVGMIWQRSYCPLYVYWKGCIEAGFLEKYEHRC